MHAGSNAHIQSSNLTTPYRLSHAFSITVNMKLLAACALAQFLATMPHVASSSESDLKCKTQALLQVRTKSFGTSLRFYWYSWVDIENYYDLDGHKFASCMVILLLLGLSMAKKALPGLAAKGKGASSAWSSCWGKHIDLKEFTLDQLVLQQARQQPAEVAVTGQEGKGMSYKDLEAIVQGLAVKIQNSVDDLKIGESRVGLLVNRGMEEVVAPLAVLRCGAAFCNLDATAPKAMVATYCEILAPALVVCSTQELQSKVPAGCPSLLLPADIFSLGSDGPVSNGEKFGTDTCAWQDIMQRPAAIWFTSGSTGTPKGVIWNHRMLTHNCQCTAKLMTLSKADTVLLKSANIWAAWEYEAFPCLVAGAAVRISKPGGQKDIEYLASVLAGEDERSQAIGRKVTCASFTSQVLMIVLQSLKQDHPGGGQQLRHLLQVGERCDASVYRSTADLLPNLVLHNMWGCTECACTIWSSTPGAPPPVEDEDAGGSLPAGRPEPIVLVRLLDSNMAEVSPGSTGSIYVGGIVADGYLGREDLTKDRFIMDPLGSKCTLFDTGDLGFVDADGQLNILGRRDRQLKLRGIRLEPEGIETALCRCPGVLKAAVVATETPAILVAFVASKSVSESAVLDFSERELAIHLRPQKVFVLSAEAWPQLPNGKTDLKSLAEKAKSMVLDEDGEQQVVDSLGQMKSMSKTHLDTKRMFDILLALMTMLMVHYHANTNIGGGALRNVKTGNFQPDNYFDNFHNKWLTSWIIDGTNNGGEWNTIGFVVAGALNDALDTTTAYVLGQRELFIIYVYLVWTVVLPYIVPLCDVVTGPAWYLLMLLTAKLILIGLRHLKVPRQAQLLVVCLLPYALFKPLDPIPVPDVFNVSYSSLFSNSIKRLDLMIYCLTFLLAPEITQTLRRCRDFEGLAVLPMAGLFVFACVQLPHDIFSDTFRVFLLASTVATAPSQLKLSWIANGALGSFVCSAGIVTVEVMEFNFWRPLFGPVPEVAHRPVMKVTQYDLFIFVKMLVNVLFIVVVMGPAFMKLIVLTIRLLARVNRTFHSLRC